MQIEQSDNYVKNKIKKTCKKRSKQDFVRRITSLITFSRRYVCAATFPHIYLPLRLLSLKKNLKETFLVLQKTVYTIYIKIEVI